MIIDNHLRRNAISFEMWAALAKRMGQFEKNRRIRVVVVRGAGQEAFAAGADISEFEHQRNNPTAMARYNAKADAAFQAVFQSSKPVIAMIHGICFGAGCALALNCDLRIAATDARFSIPAAKLGVAYPFDCVKRLADIVGTSAAREILYTARVYTADEALRIGLIHRTALSDILMTRTRKYAAQIADKAPLSIQAAKLMIDEYLKPAMDQDGPGIAAIEKRCVNSRDYREGARAFFEKRKPRFIGK